MAVIARFPTNIVYTNEFLFGPPHRPRICHRSFVKPMNHHIDRCFGHPESFCYLRRRGPFDVIQIYQSNHSSCFFPLFRIGIHLRKPSQYIRLDLFAVVRPHWYIMHSLPMTSCASGLENAVSGAQLREWIMPQKSP